MFRIFTKEVIAKEKATINLTQEEVDLILEGDYYKDYKDLDPSLHCVVEQNYSFEYPTYDEEKNTIREMTLIERYNNKLYTLAEHEIVHNNSIVQLQPGQYLDTASNSIITVDKIEGVKVEWNWETNSWIEKATKDEQLEYCKQEILKNTRELLVFEKSGFSNDELQKKIDALVEKHKILSEEIVMNYNKE